jgi:hypothetical protein
VTLAALVQPREASFGAAAALPPAASPGALSPAKGGWKPAGSFFVLPANATGTQFLQRCCCMREKRRLSRGWAARAGNATAGRLASHPINMQLSPGISDLDTPAGSPLAATSHASPFN